MKYYNKTTTNTNMEILVSNKQLTYFLLQEMKDGVKLNIQVMEVFCGDLSV